MLLIISSRPACYAQQSSGHILFQNIKNQIKTQRSRDCDHRLQRVKKRERTEGEREGCEESGREKKKRGKDKRVCAYVRVCEYVMVPHLAYYQNPIYKV